MWYIPFKAGIDNRDVIFSHSKKLFMENTESCNDDYNITSHAVAYIIGEWLAHMIH